MPDSSTTDYALRMLNRVLVVIGVSWFFLVGCGNADENASIDESLLGIKAFREGDLNQAVGHFRKAVSIYPQNHIAHYNLGKVFQSQSKWKEAAGAFSSAAKHNSKDAMYAYAAGRANYEAQYLSEAKTQLSEAETQLDHAVSLNERLYKAHYFLGKVHGDSDRPDKAAQAWTTSAKLNPFFGKPFIELGRLYLKWDFIEQAIKVLKEGSRHVIEATELSQIFLILGLAYDTQKNWDKSIEAYSKAIEMPVENVEAKLQRGFAYAKKGESKSAKKDLNEFIKLGGGGNSFNMQAANQILMRLALDETVQ